MELCLLISSHLWRAYEIPRVGICKCHPNKSRELCSISCYLLALTLSVGEKRDVVQDSFTPRLVFAPLLQNEGIARESLCSLSLSLLRNWNTKGYLATVMWIGNNICKDPRSVPGTKWRLIHILFRIALVPIQTQRKTTFAKCRKQCSCYLLAFLADKGPSFLCTCHWLQPHGSVASVPSFIAPKHVTSALQLTPEEPLQESSVTHHLFLLHPSVKHLLRTVCVPGAVMGILRYL